MKITLVASLFLFFAGFIIAQEKIDINSAPLEDLMKIVHIGEARARELISLRPFSSLDDLTRIKGIGESRVADIKNQGLAWIEAAEVAETRRPQTLIIPAVTPATNPAVTPTINETGSDPVSLNITDKKPANFSFFVAVFTSLLSGGIIMILKKYVRT